MAGVKYIEREIVAKLDEANKHLRAIKEKNSNVELRQCKDTNEMAGACRFIHGFLEGSEPDVTKAHLQSFKDFCGQGDEPGWMCYGTRCIKKDLNRGIYEAIQAFFAFTQDKQHSWPDFAFGESQDQINSLCIWHPEFQKLLRHEFPSDTEMLKKLPKIEEIPELHAMIQLVECIDHRGKVHEKVHVCNIINKLIN